MRGLRLVALLLINMLCFRDFAGGRRGLFSRISHFFGFVAQEVHWPREVPVFSETGQFSRSEVARSLRLGAFTFENAINPKRHRKRFFR